MFLRFLLASLSVVLVLSVLPAVTSLERVKTYSLKRSDGSDIVYHLISSSSPAHDATEKRSLLIALQGSDCNSALNNPALQHDLWALRPRSDLLLVEKRGIDETLVWSDDPERADCPQEAVHLDTPGRRAGDVSRVLAGFPDSEIHYSSIVAVGGSEGAVVAALLNEKIWGLDAIVMFNSGGRNFRDDIEHSMAASIPDPEQLKAVRSEFLGFWQMVRTSREPLEFEVSGHGYNWWREMVLQDLWLVLLDARAPVLLIQGGQDEAVSPRSVDRLVRDLQKERPEILTYELLPELDHRLYDLKGQNRMNEVMQGAAFWLKDHLTEKAEGEDPGEDLMQQFRMPLSVTR